MKRVALTFSPSEDSSPALMAAVWVAFAGLAVALLISVGERRAIDARLSEMGVQESSAAMLGASHHPVGAELAKAAYLAGHATLRSADWNAALAALGAALPAGTIVERISLNARTGKGEAVVRMSRMTDAARFVERLNKAGSGAAAVVRRCDQSGARSEMSMRCDIELPWRAGTP